MQNLAGVLHILAFIFVRVPSHIFIGVGFAAVLNCFLLVVGSAFVVVLPLVVSDTLVVSLPESASLLSLLLPSALKKMKTAFYYLSIEGGERNLYQI